MKFVTINQWQLLMLAIATAVIATALMCCFYFYVNWTLLPVVYRDAAGKCTKVDNFENGHAFNCEDVDVILRRYRAPNDKKIPAIDLHELQKGS